VAALISPPSRRPAQRGRGAWRAINKEGPIGPRRWRKTSTPPPRHRIGRGRPPPYRPNRPSELARKGQHVRPVLPERVCGSDATRRDKPSGSQFSPLGRTAPSEHPSDQVSSQSRFRTGPAERRPSAARPTDDRSDRLATNAVRDVSGLPGHRCASLRSAQARSARRPTSQSRD
jgi:hypothetical protein